LSNRFAELNSREYGVIDPLPVEWIFLMECVAYECPARTTGSAVHVADVADAMDCGNLLRTLETTPKVWMTFQQR